MFRTGWLLALCCGVGCATPYQAGVVQKEGTRYFVGDGPPGWSRQGFSDNDVAFVSPNGQHTLAVNATCEGYRDAPLPVLLRHLLMGFTKVETVSQDLAPLDGRERLLGHYVARLDGVPVELGLAVLKKDGCIYDFTYLSPPGHYDEAKGALARLLATFRTEGR
jgi:hypothetical protein